MGDPAILIISREARMQIPLEERHHCLACVLRFLVSRWCCWLVVTGVFLGNSVMLLHGVFESVYRGV